MTYQNLEEYLVPKSYFDVGGLWVCGYNQYGKLGVNSTLNKSSPVQTSAGGGNWKIIGTSRVHAGGIKTDGTLWLWGYNTNGQLGDVTTAHRSNPIQTVAAGSNWKSLAIGGYHTGAIKTDGTLWMCGYNTNGALGDNTVAHKSSPVQTVTGGSNWKQVACGYYHTAAVKTDGTLWGWGYDLYGQLGDALTTKKSSPVQTVAGGTTWKSVACGQQQTAGIKTDGTLWLWGQNTNGQLCHNTIADRSSPVQTVTGGAWKQVVIGNGHTLAIKTDGSLWTCGQNTVGQLGNALVAHKSSPVQTVAGGSDWKTVACGAAHSVAIKIDGTLWTWGNNTYGSLGDSTVAHKSSPVQTVVGGSDWKTVANGSSGWVTAAIQENTW